MTNTTAFHNTRIDGRASFVEIGLFRNEYLQFEHLGIRRLSNATEANFRPLKRVGLYGAYRLSTRRVRTADALRFPDFEFGRELTGTDNGIRSGAAGIRWLPSQGVRASFDFEIGRADRPLTPTSERRFHNEAARVRWRKNRLSLGGYFRNRVNDNPSELLAYSSKSRAQGVQAAWTDPASGLIVDGGYNLLDLDVSAGILNLFDLGGEQPDRSRSVYASRIHNLNFGFRSQPHERITVHAGLSMTRDTGAGAFDALAAEPSRFFLDGAVVVSSLPMSYRSPSLRVSIAIREWLSWNCGWQQYRYAERWEGSQGYRANTGYSSLSLSF